VTGSGTDSVCGASFSACKTLASSRSYGSAPEFCRGTKLGGSFSRRMLDFDFGMVMSLFMSVPAPATCPYIFDLVSHMRSNPVKARRINEAVAALKIIEHRMAKGEPVVHEMQKHLSSLVSLCGHNLGLLIPYLFPAYPTDSPLSLLARPYMFALLSMGGNVNVTFRAGRQVGKCVVGSTVLRTNRGLLTIADVFSLGGDESCAT